MSLFSVARTNASLSVLTQINGLIHIIKEMAGHSVIMLFFFIICQKDDVNGGGDMRGVVVI